MPSENPPQSRGERIREQIGVLADLAAEAIALQPAANSAVSQCGAPGIVSNAVGLELGGLSRAFSLIFERARHLPVDADLTGARAELCRLLTYHMYMLRDAGQLAFSGRVDERTEPFRRELALGLGPFANALVIFEGELRGRSTASAERVFDRWADPDEFQLDDINLGEDEP